MDNAILERIGLCVDRLENLSGASVLPIPDAMHLQALRAAIPEIRDEIKDALREAGFDPWGDI